MLARRRWSQADLGEVLGVTQTQVSARLRGDADWRFDDLWTAAKSFGVPLSTLIRAVEAADLAERGQVSA
jgi:transcriptional regulator with XRE-family HTH domain